MRTGGNFFRCVLSAMLLAALSAPGLAEPAVHATTRALEVQASDESPQAAAARRVEAMFRRQERGIRQAINDRQFQLARERVETARRRVESACRGLQSPEPRRELMLELDSLARFIGSEERMIAARQARGVPQSSEKLEPGSAGDPVLPGEPARPRAGGPRAKKEPAPREQSDRPTDARPAHGRLRQVVPMVHFPEGTSFEEVLNWLRQRSGLSIDVNWRALAELGIDRTTDTLGLTLNGARFETVLRLVLDNISPPETPLDYDTIDGVVRISTRENLDRCRITRVYDVSDLLIRVPSFGSEAGGFGMGGAMGMGMGTMGGMGMGMTGAPGLGTQGQQPGFSR